MHSSVNNLQPVRVIESRSNINKERKLAVISGPRESTYFRDVSTSYSTASVNHSITPPANSILDTKFLMVWYVQLVFTGTTTSSASPPLMGSQVGTYDGPRSFPISNAVTSTTVSINGQSVNFSNYDLISGLSHYLGDNDTRKCLSGALPFDDQFQNYSEVAQSGFNRNPLGLYGENYYQDCRSAGVIPFGQSSTTYTVQLTIIEPVFASPLTWGKMQSAGLAGCQNLTFQFQIGDMTRMWSHATGSGVLDTISAIVPSFYQPPELYYTVLSPNRDVDPYRLGNRYEYPYFNITPYSNYVGTVTSNTVATVNSGNITLTSIPSRFYVFVRQTNSNRTYTSSDTFAAINNINITWDNRSGLLSNASSYQLHQISVKNGSNQSWQQWTNYQGSVFCCEMGSDIGLLENQAPGMMGNYQLQAQIGIKNTNTTTNINYSVYIVPVLPGAFLLEGTQASLTTNLITEQEILRAKTSGVSLSHLESLEPFGGSFFGDLWSGIKKIGKKVLDVGTKALPVISTFAPGVGAIANALLPAAHELFETGENPQSGGYMKRAMKHKKLTKKQLLDRL